MIALIEHMAKSLVDEPEKISVESIDGEDGTTFKLHVGASDMGRVVGKQGRTARSLRTILAAAGAKANKKYSLDIVE
jgi:predicted RNA-binding protein YlqC (UPF0109 family)